MLICVHQLFKSRVVFHTLDLWNEVGAPDFLAFLTQVTHYLTALKMLKNSIHWKVFAGTSLTSKRTKKTMSGPSEVGARKRVVREQTLSSRIGRRESGKKDYWTTFPSRPLHSQPVSSRPFRLSETVHGREDGCMTIESVISGRGWAHIITDLRRLKELPHMNCTHNIPSITR